MKIMMSKNQIYLWNNFRKKYKLISSNKKDEKQHKNEKTIISINSKNFDINKNEDEENITKKIK